MYIVPLIAEGSSDFKGDVVFLIDQEKVSGLFKMFRDSEIPLLITGAGRDFPIS